MLTGFSFTFSYTVDSSRTMNPANFELDSVTVTKLKGKTRKVLHPITNFTVSYNPADEQATLLLTGRPTFPSGGQITVLSGVAGDENVELAGPTVFSISPMGKHIAPQ